MNDNFIFTSKESEHLAGLKKLYLSNNEIKSIRNRRKVDGQVRVNLETLDLQHNKIESLEGIESQTELSELYLNCNKIKQIHQLKLFGKPESVGLWNQIESIEGVEIFKKISVLDLKSNQLKRIEMLANLPNLNYSLTNNQIESIDTIENMTSLKYLDLNSNKINLIDCLRNLPKLNYLILSRDTN